MKNFWPHRSKAKGFSIQNLARKYRLKLSSVSTSEISNQFLDDRNLVSKIDEHSKKISINKLSMKRTHWANRDFSEYKKVAWFYFFEEMFLVACIFLVRGIVDKINDIINNKVIPTRLQKVMLDSSNSPNETVRYEFNFNWLIIYQYNFSNDYIFYNYYFSSFKIYTYFFFPSPLSL